jgi:SAM-dependent methyltransferase
LAKKKLGRNIFNCELKDCHFPDSYFDVVTLNHVLEHIPDPNEELREIRRILKDGGTLLLSTPNIDSLQFKISKERWFGLDLPRHLYYYSYETIVTMLEKNGFDVVKVTYPLLDFPLDFFHSLKAKWLYKGSKLLNFKILILPPLLIASMLIKLHPAWRGSVEIIAQKIPEFHNFSWKGGKDNWIVSCIKNLGLTYECGLHFSIASR